MDSHFGLIEISLAFAVALALLSYELYAVRKSIRDDARNSFGRSSDAERGASDSD